MTRTNFIFFCGTQTKTPEPELIKCPVEVTMVSCGEFMKPGSIEKISHGLDFHKDIEDTLIPDLVLGKYFIIHI